VTDLAEFFRRDELGRGAYLSRLFAFFSEEVVRHWAACDEAPFRDVGRPVLWDEDARRYHVLDFTLERRSDGSRFVTEMKCEIQFEGYRYVTLEDAAQIEHHTGGAAFQKLLRVARDPAALRVTVAGQRQVIAGAALVWGATTDAGIVSAVERFGFAEVLSLEEILRDLAEWQPESWREWLATRRRWSDELFEWLAYAPKLSKDA
jgi:hypothetical protein